jgi:4-diphosphocytidyl-2-C-methyl-D-erythritol kinase
MPAGISYRAYAKINLYLDVLNRRRDGYHNIETIFQTISLADMLSFEERAGRISLTCAHHELDTGEENLICRAAALLRRESGYNGGVKIHLEKNIPIAAGLAGGSGNAAATLTALNRLWNLRWHPARLQRLALRLGADVPYCMIGGTAVATLRGEELHKLPELEKTWFVLVQPQLAVSASHVYHHALLGKNPERPFAGRTPALRRRLNTLKYGDTASIVFNRMETPVFHEHPGLRVFRDRLLELGCSAAAMSGSGPALFGICASKDEAAKIAGAFTQCPASAVFSVPSGIERMT